MDTSDKTEAMEPMDQELEARIRRADFSGEAPGLLQRLWVKIQSRVAETDEDGEMLEDIDLSSEEMSMLTAARGNPFEGLGKLPKDGKKK